MERTPCYFPWGWDRIRACASDGASPGSKRLGTACVSFVAVGTTCDVRCSLVRLHTTLSTGAACRPVQLSGISSHCTRPDPTDSSPAGKLIRPRPRYRPVRSGSD